MAKKSSSYSVEPGWITKSFTSKISGEKKAQNKKNKLKREQFLQKFPNILCRALVIDEGDTRRRWRRGCLVFCFFDKERNE